MASVTDQPSPTYQPPGTVHRKPVPVPLSNITADPFSWDAAQHNGNASSIESPRLRAPPISPVHVKVQPDTWPQPSNVNIEEDGPQEHGAQTGEVFGHQSSEQYQPYYGQASPTLPELSAFPAAPVDLPIRTNETPKPTGAQSYAAQPPQQGGVDFDFQFRSAQDTTVPAQEQTPASQAPELDDQNRHSRDTDTTASTRQQNSAESSAGTSSSSVIEAIDGQESSGRASPSQVYGSQFPRNQSVPQFQYHHNGSLPQRASSATSGSDPRAASDPELAENGVYINRHLTPTSQFVGRRSSITRPPSAYSAYSDLGPARGRSPGLMPQGAHARAPSAHSRRSPDFRPTSYAEMLNVPYPQPAPAPIVMDNSQLRTNVGTNASLLSTEKTLEMYRANVKKTNDFSIQYSFAVFLVSTAQEQGLNWDEAPRRRLGLRSGRDTESPSYVEGSSSGSSSPQELVREAKSILQRLANAGYPFAQYYLADGLASGLFNKGREDYGQAFPLFTQAARHGHAESAYRAALCYEFGAGCRRDPAKAVQFLRTAAFKRHPGAMTRLGRASLSGDLGEKKYKDGIKWLKLAIETADTIYNAAPYHLGCLYETGYGDDIFQDESYAAELFTQAANLGHPEANYRMGDAYEHGKLNCPRDPALSVHYYTGAAERGHAGAMMGLCAWYMVGAPPILEKDEEEAYEWARKSAELNCVKAQYAVGYFTEMGIGCRKDPLEANVWYVKAADAGDERAKQRLAAIREAISGGGEAVSGRLGRKKTGDDKECTIM